MLYISKGLVQEHSTEALLLILDDKLVPGLFDELPESGVALPGLIHERVQTGGEDVFDVEDGREVGRQSLGQGAQAQNEVQETVDGGNVEAVPVTEDAVYPDPGRLRGDGIPVLLPGAEGYLLEDGEHAVLHFSGRCVGEGDGQDAPPVVGLSGTGFLLLPDPGAAGVLFHASGGTLHEKL